MAFVGKKTLGLDFETYSNVDLKKHGLDRYIAGKDFTVLCASIYGKTVSPGGYTEYDFVMSPVDDLKTFMEDLKWYVTNGYSIFAQNAGFERAVMGEMGFEYRYARRILDSAVIARCEGASSSLEQSLKQLTTVKKLESGLEGIRTFSIPNEWNEGKPPTIEKILSDSDMLNKWTDFKRYCTMDAHGSFLLGKQYTGRDYLNFEHHYEELTSQQNRRGWPVDLKLVREMQYRYEQNLQEELLQFYSVWDPDETLNFNSPKQLVKWCADRGVKADSFDTEHVEKLLPKITAKLESMDDLEQKYRGYQEVEAMLKTKQILGGTGLKKLQVILDTVGADGRLRHQYMHCGAGQSFRTTGRGVQMQNIKRLSGELFDMPSLYDTDTEADNDTLGSNLRQVFTSSNEGGELIVGDFSSVESRGLAWLAGADWKIHAYEKGQDLYKVLASSIFSVDYDDITKDQRQTGKLGELSCGYQAGPVAVKRVADKMRIPMTEVEALKLVRDWRSVNPEVENLWATIDEGLHQAVDTRTTIRTSLSNGLKMVFRQIDVPESLASIHPGACSMMMELHDSYGNIILQRALHGCYKRGRNICIYKPSDGKTGPPWKNHFTDQKTKKIRFYDVYGGKLAGILTQSYCRELFFASMYRLENELKWVSNAEIIGQFHDEIVVDWWPANGSHSRTLEQVQEIMRKAMSTVPVHSEGFPLEADIKHAYRYIK